MQAQKPELLAEYVNSWFADKPSSYMVRSMDYGAGQVARARLSERYRRIDNMEIATAVLPLFAGNDQYEVMSCEVTENRLYLKVVNHRLEMEIRNPTHNSTQKVHAPKRGCASYPMCFI